MKPPPFEYVRASTLGEAIATLSHNEDARILAGGQSLMAMMNLRYIFPSILVDINELHELAGISASPQLVRIGAMTRQRAIETSPALAGVAPIFQAAVHLVGHRQTRNRGTIGGSLCHLDPAAELPTLALLHDCTIEATGPNGPRRIAVADFITGYMTPGIAADEIVTAVEFAPWAPGHGYGFHEFARRHGDFAIASAAVLVERAADRTIERVAICVGGVGSVPQRHVAGEEALTGTKGDEAAVALALDRCSQLDYVADFHGGEDYRLSVARTMLRRSLADALDETRSGKAAA
ncbi:hypothetical protein LL06_00350 [Hoeflea sp. BAL378]|uniref:FAD binding domain-containing protein n=1 Tax=Hoeflea sp. BAL378 TaxID=1547437 RepID=UPI0005145925|nr:FAD binding domain-containing protein [Hoeflea sp. BAL378]KGF71282.1 hypothetical protein LL06_00350 [Hoeflea sp. BAL378]